MYKQAKNNDGSINPNVILKDGEKWIPNDEANVDWQEYQAWLAEGNQPLAADE